MKKDGRKTWLITGCSSGLGLVLSSEVLMMGHRAVITARRPETLLDVVNNYPESAIALKLDVTNKDDIRNVVHSAEKDFGGIDVLVNNAGYVLVGGVEEISDDEYRDLFDTNFFGAVDMIQAVLPGMRQYRRGHIINISSVGAISNGIGMSMYGASKAALASISESLAQEIEPHGIKVTIIEPAGFPTQAVSNRRVAKKVIEEYKLTVGEHRKNIENWMHQARGNLVRAAHAIIRISNEENPPLRLPLGKEAVDRTYEKIEIMRCEIEQWKDLASSTTDTN